MKKLISMGLIITTSFLVGCGVNKTIEAETKSNINFTQVGKDPYFYVYRDEETGVNYVLYSEAYGSGICPRYKADGSLYVD